MRGKTNGKPYASHILPEGSMSPLISMDREVILKGLMEGHEDLKGKKLKIKGMTEIDVSNIRSIICKEIKIQNEKEFKR